MASGHNPQRDLPTSPGRPRFFYGYLVVLAGFVIYATTFGIATAFGVFFTSLIGEFGWTRAMTAGSFTLYSLMSGVLGIAMGRLTDRFGPRMVVMTFGSFIGIGCLLMSQIDVIWQLYLIWGVLVPIGRSTAIVPVTATLARWFRKKRALVTGIVTAGGAGVGGLVLSPVAGWLVQAYGWRTAYIIAGAAALALILASGRLLKRDPKEIGELPDGSPDAEGTTAEKQQSPQRLSLRKVLGSRQFWILSVIFFSYGFCRGTIMVHVVAHVTDLGFSLADGSYVLAVVAGVSAASGIGTGRLADIIGSKRILMISHIVVAGAFFWAPAAGEMWMLYLFAVVFGLGRGGTEVLRFPLTAEQFGLGAIGVIIGALELVTTIGTALGPLVAGNIFDATGTYDAAFVACGAMALMGLIATWLLTLRRFAPVRAV